MRIPGRTIAFVLLAAAVSVARQGLPLDRAVRIGGMVRRGSLHRHPDGVTIDFLVGDETAGDHPGPLSRASRPDLFREGSGVIAEGRFQPDGSFVANEILAKHDENYMPPRARPGAACTRRTAVR